MNKYNYYENPYEKFDFLSDFAQLGKEWYDLEQSDNTNKTSSRIGLGIQAGLGLLSHAGNNLYNQRIRQSQQPRPNYVNTPYQNYGYQYYSDDMYRYQVGGKSTYNNIQELGYKDTSPYNNFPFIDIDSNKITMKGVSKPLLAIPDKGSSVIMQPGMDYNFPQASRVREIPFQTGNLYQTGGELYGQYDYSVWENKPEQITSSNDYNEVADNDEDYITFTEDYRDRRQERREVAMRDIDWEDTRIKPNPDYLNSQVNNLQSNVTAAVRNNSPLNMKYSPYLAKFGARPGKFAKEGDGTREAMFDNIEQGLAASQALWETPAYSNLTVENGLKRWSANTYDKNIYKELQPILNKSFKELTPEEKALLVKKQVKFEDGNMYKRLYGSK